MLGNSRFTKEHLQDLLCNAFEGGSNYWYEIESFGYPPGVTAKSLKAEGKYPHLELPLIKGGALVIFDCEDPDERWTLDREAIKRGLVALKEKYPDRHYRDALDPSVMDACTGDVFLQCCLFGDVVYG